MNLLHTMYFNGRLPYFQFGATVVLRYFVNFFGFLCA